MSFVPPEPITVGENAYRHIRSDILFGRLPPSQKLKLERLRETYGTGIGTLREILSRLSSEGLVVAEGQRGFEVAPTSAANLREIAALRLLLESHAMEGSFRDGDVEWEGRVVSAHHKLARLEGVMAAGERQETEAWKRYDWQFHEALISACGSRALMEAHAAAYDKYLRYQMVALVFRGDIAAGEHRELLEAALERDAGRAADILRRHLDGCVAYTLDTGRLGGPA